MKHLLLRLICSILNDGGPIALYHVLVPFFSTVYGIDGRQYRTGYVFGIRIFRYLTR